MGFRLVVNPSNSGNLSSIAQDIQPKLGAISQVNKLPVGLQDKLDKLTNRARVETLTQQRIATVLDAIKRIDAEIDERVLDLYSITDATDRQRVLGSAPIEEEEAIENIEDDV
ncbi:MAG: hypothetical protein NVS4B11_25510 [Ktedonobacteraceae bacterium]